MSEEDKEYNKTITYIDDLVKSLELNESEIRTLCELSGVEYEDWLIKKKRKISSEDQGRLIFWLSELSKEKFKIKYKL